MSNPIYSYIASADPYFVKGLCNKYGYRTNNARTKTDLGVCLEQLVQAEGEQAFRDMMQAHPDKDAILEIFSPVPAVAETYHNADGGSEKGCGCKSCGGCNKHNNNGTNSELHYLNASGNHSNNSTVITSIAIVSAFTLLGIALIKSKGDNII